MRVIKILTVCFLVFFAASCSQGNIEPSTSIGYRNDLQSEITVIEIDSCEYLFATCGSDSRGSVLTHKGNCKNHGK